MFLRRALEWARLMCVGAFCREMRMKTRKNAVRALYKRVYPMYNIPIIQSIEAHQKG